jgi:16S rRNA C967 or C1407 C5-methylase (RsmB/RsmF family)
MQDRGLAVEELTVPIPRYIRVKPKHEISQNELASSLGLNHLEMVRVDEYFWAINPNCKISQCPLYEQGKIYGMDYSSSIPVLCLEI